MSSPIAIVLGGTNPHAELCRNLKRRGYHVVLIDYYENPPAKAAADEHIRESTLDKEAVLRIVRKKNASLVISACVDQANAIASYVAEQLNLPHPYSYETALDCSDKTRMKRIMKANGIPTSDFIIAENINDALNHNLPYPVVVKPADSNGSKGVRKIDDASMLSAAVNDAFTVSRAGKVVIEEYCEGDEFSVDCFINEYAAHVLMLRRKYNMIARSDSVIQCFASVTPGRVGKVAHEAIQSICEKIAKAFGIRTSSLLVQVIVNGDQVRVIEFSPRVGGGLSYRTVNLNTEFDILDATVSSYLGEPVAMHYSDPKQFFATNNIYGNPGSFSRIENHQELLAKGVISEFYQNKSEGMIIGSDFASKDRIGAFIVKSDSAAELLEKIKTAMNKLQAYDMDGNEILIREICVKKL